MEELKARMAALVEEAFAAGAASVPAQEPVVVVDLEAAKAEAVAAEKARIRSALEALLS